MAQNKRIMLFGRTGSGKSTLGNMLYSRKINPEGSFAIGDSFRGIMAEVDHRHGNGWIVIDMIGIEETSRST